MAGRYTGTSSAQALDADAPYLVESYQNSENVESLQNNLPTYTYSKDPQTPGEPRSWEDAARAKSKPIVNSKPGMPGHVYVDMDNDEAVSRLPGVAGAAPTPLNTTITGYATNLGWELSKLCAAAYIFPPFTSVLLLIFETQNDLVRFHAYQSGLAGAAVLILSWLWNWFFGWGGTLIRRVLLGVSWYLAYLAHQSATSLERRPFLQILGEYAVSFVGDE